MLGRTDIFYFILHINKNFGTNERCQQNETEQYNKKQSPENGLLTNSVRYYIF